MMPKDMESVPVQVIDEQEAIVGIVEATRERSRRRFGRDTWFRQSDNRIIGEVAVDDLNIVVGIGMVSGGTGGIVDSVDSGCDFVFRNKVIDG